MTKSAWGRSCLLASFQENKPFVILIDPVVDLLSSCKRSSSENTKDKHFQNFLGSFFTLHSLHFNPRHWSNYTYYVKASFILSVSFPRGSLLWPEDRWRLTVRANCQTRSNCLSVLVPQVQTSTECDPNRWQFWTRWSCKRRACCAGSQTAFRCTASLVRTLACKR